MLSASIETHSYEQDVPQNNVELRTLAQLKEMYVDSLSPKEKKAYLIARDHLGMSFTLEKSVGFLQWKKTFLR
jgi:hypothetical protein